MLVDLERARIERQANSEQRARLAILDKHGTNIGPMPASQPTSKTTLPRSVAVLPNSLPLLQYTSLLGTQTLLLLFTALFLPRTTVLVLPSVLPSQKTSLDRPQHPFIEPLTTSPAWTLAWICLGTGVVISWWAGWVKVWHFEAHRATNESPDATRLKKATMPSKPRVIFPPPIEISVAD